MQKKLWWMYCWKVWQFGNNNQEEKRVSTEMRDEWIWHGSGKIIEKSFDRKLNANRLYESSEYMKNKLKKKSISRYSPSKGEKLRCEGPIERLSEFYMCHWIYLSIFYGNNWRNFCQQNVILETLTPTRQTRK